MSTTRHPVIIEILGIAGSGKSSLARALLDGGYVRPPFISASNPQHLIVMLRSLPRLWPLIAQNLTRPPRMTWADFKLMAYITGWRSFLQGLPGYHDQTLVFDQGPLYALGRLEARGLGIVSTRNFRRWWDEMLSVWANEMSLVVWLDAGDAHLLDRINERSQNHTIKDRPVEEGARFIGRYRKVFTFLLSRVEVLSTTEVFRFDTTNLSTVELAERVHDWVRNHSNQ